jgi:hypothetical protein
MSDYFNHNFLSNSDLKRFQTQLGMKRQAPANLDAIFSLGTLIHQVILEPNLADRNHEGLELAMAIRASFWKDPLCRMFALGSDFVQEKEFYNPATRIGPYEVATRCKMDGCRERMKSYLEIKGLSVDTEKAFNDAIVDLDYDQAVAHYFLTSGFNSCLLAGFSKRNPDRVFKKIIKRYDNFYAEGEQKIIDTLTLLRDYAPDDVKLVA